MWQLYLPQVEWRLLSAFWIKSHFTSFYLSQNKTYSLVFMLLPGSRLDLDRTSYVWWKRVQQFLSVSWSWSRYVYCTFLGTNVIFKTFVDGFWMRFGMKAPPSVWHKAERQWRFFYWGLLYVIVWGLICEITSKYSYETEMNETDGLVSPNNHDIRPFWG